MNVSLQEFCQKNCDRLYNPNLSENEQSTGYLQLKEMVVNKITPASLEEIERWENHPTIEELLNPPNIKYLRFLHPLLRPYIVKNWETIKNLSI